MLNAARRTDDPGDPHAWRDAAVLLALREAALGADLDAVRALASGYDALLVRVPERRNGVVVLTAGGSAERRHRGAFSTPPVLATALAARALPVIAEPPPRVVDPACGAGALLRAALARLLQLGVPPSRAATCLYGVDADPVAVSLCRAVLAADLTDAGFPCRASDLAGRIVIGDALLGPPATGGEVVGSIDGAPAGLAWDVAFPEVLAVADAAAEPVTGWRGGFDAVVANPPWERLKVLAKDWRGAPPATLRGTRAAVARAVRNGGRHPLTGVGELNAYLPFVETCWRLLAPSGHAAVLTPAGIASDRSAARLLEALAAAGSLHRIHLMEPAEALFAGVSGRVGVAVVELRGGPARDSLEDGGPTQSAEVAVGLTGPDDPPGPRAWRLDAALLRLVNPNTGTAPLFGSARDAAIVSAVHRRSPVLIRRDRATGAVVDDAWHLRLVTPLHMTRDAPRFRSGPGDGLLPLWEAKHVGLLDPHGGGRVVENGDGVRRAVPRHWVPADIVQARYGDLCARGWLAGYRNVATVASPRTLVPAPLPVVAVGNSLPLLSAPRLPLLLAALASLPVDYLMRQKHAGANLNFFKLEQVPLPSPDAYDRAAPWDTGVTVGDWVLRRFARAVTWAPGLEALADELRHSAPIKQSGSVSTDADRLLALAELDAAHAVLLGMDRDDLTHVLSTFTALRERERRRHGTFATAARVLAAFDVLTGADPSR